MKITFIRPNLADYRSHDAMQPMAFAILSALTPAEIQRELFDEKVEPVALDIHTDLVALSVESFTARRAYALADHFRQRGIPVVMGGYHPSLVPDEAALHADAIVCGEAEGVWPLLLEDFIKGTLKPRYRADATFPLDGLKFDRSIFAGKKYLPIIPVQFTRGCRYHCDFCSVSEFHRFQWRSRPVDDVLSEIGNIPERLILLGDDNIFADSQQLEELLTGLIPLRKKWVCQASIDIAHKPEMVRLMAASGCIAVLIGFESLAEGNLRQMKKDVNILKPDYAAAIGTLHRHKIMVYGSFVFGYDHDTKDVFKQTLLYTLQHHFFLCNFNILMPLPGTALYRRFLKEGRLSFKDWWLNDEYRYNKAAYRCRAMSSEELEEGSWNVRRSFNSIGNILRRLIGMVRSQRSVRHLPVFILANAIAHREIHLKNRIRLGGNAENTRHD